MRGKVAKKLKKEAYKDLSPRKRVYSRGKNGQLLNMDERCLYKDLKTDHKRGEE